jgi:hypothetical protein
LNTDRDGVSGLESIVACTDQQTQWQVAAINVKSRDKAAIASRAQTYFELI